MIAKLLEYIPYFENDLNRFYKWESSYPKYDEKLLQFIRDVYESDLLKTDYLEYLGDRDPVSSIPTADMEILRAILTYFVRKERFFEGAWVSAVKEKIFLQILTRLKALND